MVSNKEQADYWDGPGGERWAKAQDRIDHHMGLITEALLTIAEVQLGQRVLDVGCGGGSTTLLLRERVGPDGGVVGIDISTPNLKLARARAHAGMADVSFIHADAASYEFQPVFDLVFSRFGVMFFDEPVSAFANIRNALVKKGQLAFACWRAFEENEWASVPYSAARDLLPAEELVLPHAPGPFAFADGGRLERILQDAGFANVRVKPHDTTMNMGASVEEAVIEALTIGPLARAASELDESTRNNIRARVAPALQTFAGPYGVTPSAAVWLVTAEN